MPSPGALVTAAVPPRRVIRPRIDSARPLRSLGPHPGRSPCRGPAPQRHLAGLDLGEQRDDAGARPLGRVDRRLPGGREQGGQVLVEVAVADGHRLDRDPVPGLDVLLDLPDPAGEGLVRSSRSAPGPRTARNAARVPAPGRAGRPSAAGPHAAGSARASGAPNRAPGPRCRPVPRPGPWPDARGPGHGRSAATTGRGTARWPRSPAPTPPSGRSRARLAWAENSDATPPAEQPAREDQAQVTDHLPRVRGARRPSRAAQTGAAGWPALPAGRSARSAPARPR